jgi:dienelactone hydrolase
MTAVRKIQVVIEGSRNLPIAVDVFYIENARPRPVIIFSHGFKGFKDWGHFNYMSEVFAKEGFVFVKFNFSHNGTTVHDPGNFSDLEAFGNNNYLIELEDLNLVMDWIGNYKPLTNEFDHSGFFLLGHSRGGGISILKAAEDSRVKKLVTWASVSDFMNRNKKKTIETWKKEGVVFAMNARTGQKMPLYYQFYESLLLNKDRLNILRAARHLTCKFLIIHGSEDEAVDVKEAQQLSMAGKNPRLLVIEGAGHTFEVRHPFIGSDLPVNAKKVIEETIRFFKS